MAIRAYIWGIRFGFTAKTALYPDRARLVQGSPELQDYEKVVQHFTETKDGWFRLCKKDFYFLIQDQHFKIYSLVVSDHQDKDVRKSYLVFGITCPAHAAIQGDVLETLGSLKALYKEKNENVKIDRNLFTAEQVQQKLKVLSETHKPTQTLDAQTVYRFTDQKRLSDILQRFSGNEVYFIPEDSNQDMVAILQYKTKDLGSIPSGVGTPGGGGTPGGRK